MNRNNTQDVYYLRTALLSKQLQILDDLVRERSNPVHKAFPTIREGFCFWTLKRVFSLIEIKALKESVKFMVRDGLQNITNNRQKFAINNGHSPT